MGMSTGEKVLEITDLGVGLLLPLWGFAELADEVREREPFLFDEPMLRFAHTLAGEGLDRVCVFFSAAGYQYGVVPFDIALIIALAWRRNISRNPAFPFASESLPEPWPGSIRSPTGVFAS